MAFSRCSFFSIVLAFFLPVLGFAQALSNYQVVSGTAMGAAPQTYWTFSETEGSTDTVCVAVNLTSAPSLQFSPRLELYDPNGAPYFGAEFDGQGAHICNRSWTATGTYKVGVFNILGGPDYYPDATASFNLEFVRPGQPFDSSQLGGGNLVSGVPSSGSLEREFYQLWSVLANAGDLVTVTASNVTGDVPGYVNLVFQGYDPNGGEISTSGPEPPVYSFRATSTGIYTILVFQSSGGNPLANPMTYAITATGSTPLSTCQVSVHPAPASYGITPAPFMQATFVAPTGAMLTDYAKTCHFEYFDWQQQITVDPGEKAVWPQNPSNVPNNVFPDPSCAMLTSVEFPLNNCLLVAGPALQTNIYGNYPPYYDPPKGGYAGGVYASLAVPFNPYPFSYYPETVTSLGNCTLTIPRDFCPPNGNFPFILSSDKTTLTFLDAPAHRSLPGDPPSTTPMAGHFIAFSTALVGVDGTGSAQTLFSWTWNSTFNGMAGSGGVTCLSGCAQTAAVAPIIPGSGTGGVTITSINGVQLPSVLSSTQVAATASGLAYSRVTQTFNGTVTITNISSSAISGPLQIVFFGMPSGITLANATSNLSGTPYMTVPAVANRWNTDWRLSLRYRGCKWSAAGDINV
jgi:hypothetical protein